MNNLLEYANKGYFECNDPNINYELLDDNESYLKNVSEIPSLPKTTTTESTISDNNYIIKEFIFDKAALNHARNLIESMWTSTTDKSHIVDYEVGETNINESNSQCVIIDYIDGHLQCCPNSVYRSIKQLIRIWKLSFDAIDIVIKSGIVEALTSLNIAVNQNQQLQAILLEKVWSAIIKFLNKKPDLFKNSIDNDDTNLISKAKPPTYFGIRAALHIKKVNLHQLEEKSRFTDFITNQPQELRKALETVVWRSRSEVILQKKALEIPDTFQEFHDDLVLSEYIDEPLLVPVDQATKSYDKALQKLTNQLIEAFNLPDPTKH
ncbi:24908_t:CDS:2 [Cetraspora pellucida]|uniref:24908_t:CDS:1 n=1 Tax=Cetraspora pellucida TaxID=1433469 RepID=A0A9N9GHK3_9GLOM|nr:24908_t:CDS:2 [Cetraspora pellucida]